MMIEHSKDECLNSFKEVWMYPLIEAFIDSGQNELKIMQGELIPFLIAKSKNVSKNYILNKLLVPLNRFLKS
jgi:hypothetical protein